LGHVLVTLSLAGLGIGADPGPWWLLPAALSAALAASLVWLLIGRRRSLDEIRRRVRGKDPASASTWTRTGVERRLQELEAELAGLREQQLRADRAQEAQAQWHRALAEEQALDDRRRALLAETGLDASLLTVQGVHRQLALLAQLDQVRGERHDAEARLGQLTRRLDASRQQLHAWLAGHGIHPGEATPSDGALRQAVETLRQTCQQAREWRTE